MTEPPRPAGEQPPNYSMPGDAPASGSGYTMPTSGAGGDYGQPATGGAGGYPPPPTSGGGGYAPPPTSGGGGYAPPPTSGAGGYAPPPTSGAGGYGPPPTSGAGYPGQPASGGPTYPGQPASGGPAYPGQPGGVGYTPPPNQAQPGYPNQQQQGYYPGGQVQPGGYPQAGGQYGGAPQGYANADEKNMILIAHWGGVAGLFILGGLGGWIGPLIAYVSKGNESPVVRAHAIATLNFHITWAGANVLAWIIAAATCFIGSPLILVTMAIPIIFGIIGAIKAGNNEFYRFPASIQIIK